MYAPKIIVLVLVMLVFSCTNSPNAKKKETSVDSSLNRLRNTPDSLVSVISIENIDRSYKVKRGQMIKDSLVVRNAYNNMAVIEQINALCDCTTLDFKKNTSIKPGDSIAVKFNIDTEAMDIGFNHRTINLIGNFYPFFKNVTITIFVSK